MPGPVVVTRPEAEARALAGRLRRAGREVVLAPVLRIVPRRFDPEPPAGPFELVVTSVNGADALAHGRFDRDTVVWAVGGATGARARAAGFPRVREADGFATGLVAALGEAAADPAARDRRLVWLSGEEVRVDLVETLGRHGWRVERRIAYAAEAVAAFPDTVVERLRRAPEAEVLFFSPRSARRFVRLLTDAVGPAATGGWIAHCLSPAVAEALRAATGEAGAASWRDVRAAAGPSTDALLALLGIEPGTGSAGRNEDDEEGDGRMTDKPEDSVTGADSPMADSPGVDSPGVDSPGAGSLMTDPPDTAEAAEDAPRTGPWGGADGVGADRTEEADDSNADDTLAAGDGADSLAGGQGEDRLDDAAPTDRVEDAEPEPARAAAGERRSGGGRVFIWLIVLGLIGVGLYTTYPAWREQAAPVVARLGFELPPVPGAETVAEPDVASESAAGTDSDPAPEPATQPADGSATDSATDTAAEGSGTVSSGSASPESGADTGSDPAPTGEGAADGAVSAAPQDAGGPTALDALSEQVDQLAAEFEALRAGTADESGAGALAERVDSLSEQLGDTRSTLSTFGDELAILRENLGNASGEGGIGPLAAELSQKLAEIESRLSGLETAEPPASVAPEELSAVADAVETLASAVDARLAEAAEARDRLADRMDAIDAALGDMNAALANTRSQSEKAGAFLIAANQLALASSRSGGFTAELEAVAVAAEAPEVDGSVPAALDTLRGLSGGVPSRTVLRDRYPGVAAAILDASVVGSDESVVGAALRNVASLFTVRRTATTDGDSIDDLVTAAENAVRAGDLQAAVDVLGRLEGDPATAAAGWLGDARDRLAVDQAVGTLQAAAIATLAGG